MYANCLRHLPDQGVTVAELAGRARTATNLDGMRRWGYVTFTPDPGPGKRPKPDALIRPTTWGIMSRDTWPAVTADVESRWRDRLGDPGFTALRAALAGIAERLDPLLPDCLPILGYGLATRRDGARGASGRQDRMNPERADRDRTDPDGEGLPDTARLPGAPDDPPVADPVAGCRCGPCFPGSCSRSRDSTRPSPARRWRSAPTSCGC